MISGEGSENIGSYLVDRLSSESKGIGENWSDDDSNGSKKNDDQSASPAYLSSEDDDEGNASGLKDKRKGKESFKGSKAKGTMLDGDFIEFTSGRPLPMTDRAKAAFHMSILNVSQLCRSESLS